MDHRVQEVRAEGGVAQVLGAAQHNIISNLLACPDHHPLHLQYNPQYILQYNLIYVYINIL